MDGAWQASDGWRFETVPEDARAMFSCVPTVNKAVVAAAVGAADAAQAVDYQLAQLLRGFASINDAARSKGIPTVGVSHGTVYGCLTEHGVPMAGFDHEFTTASLFSAGASAFMLGHIHKHQLWEDSGRVIAYAGSIGRFHYGEQGDKGFLLWEIDADAARCELVSTPARRTIDITFEGMPDLDALRQCASKQVIAGAYVRVRWNMPEEDRHQIDRTAIERILGGAVQIKLEGRVIPVVRTRAAGIAQEQGVAAKVRAWATTTESDAALMLHCLEALQQHTPEQIASSILALPIASGDGLDRPGCAAILDADQVSAADRKEECNETDFSDT
jgi:exonuclease SbcD